MKPIVAQEFNKTGNLYSLSTLTIHNRSLRHSTYVVVATIMLLSEVNVPSYIFLAPMLSQIIFASYDSLILT
jgi:hypothetical protein